MPKQKRSIKFHISLTPEEREQAQCMAADNDLSMAELFRAKTLKNQLPRRVTKIAGQTYWELTKISSCLSAIKNALETSPLAENPTAVNQELLEQVRIIVSQVRREITNLDFTTEIEDEL